MRTAIVLFCAVFASAASAGPVSSWAIVAADATLVRGSHAVAAVSVSPGNYVVDFDGSVKKCAFTASLGDGQGSEPGYVTVAAANKDVTGVYIVTFDADGNAVNRGFHLNVRC